MGGVAANAQGGRTAIFQSDVELRAAGGILTARSVLRDVVFQIGPQMSTSV